MNGEELTVKCTVAFFGCIEFPADKYQRDVEYHQQSGQGQCLIRCCWHLWKGRGVHKGLEKQGCIRCERFLGCDEGF